jgi:hypothetical protein
MTALFASDDSPGVSANSAGISAPCELCRKVIRMGPVYEGRYVHAHDAIVCNDCWAGDCNGWRSQHEKPG